MKKLTFFVLIAVFFAACEKETIEPQVQNEEVQLKSANKPEKVKIWHLKGNGEYVLIEVAPSAVDAHLAHGDMLYCEPDFYQDFEDNSEGWYGDVNLVNGYAEIGGGYTWFDDPSDVWPENGWTAEIDVYLDPNWEVGSFFEYTVAAYGSDGEHQRDFVFHVGVTSEKGLAINADNNSYTNDPQGANMNILNNGDDSYPIPNAGWYTLQHQFYNDNGVLAVDLNLVDSDGNNLWTKTRSNPDDVISIDDPDLNEIGGNGYGWFPLFGIDGGIMIDNLELFRGCTP